ncbi:MAG: sugar phosphate isomerase/epimerase [Planctomycetes bacterium HGW-Planctomycetes-1]|nr:MAG: sugar phosphate isomerase/epimerase [Planctomycetes bacterium HGW-Planctomycetes-1]
MNRTENIAYNSKLGIFSWFGWRLHISQRAKLIKDAGFDTTCLWWAAEERANTGSLDDLPKIVRDNGLEIDNVHVPFAEAHLLSSENQLERRGMVDMHKQWIEDCARHKIPKLVFHTCPAYDNPPPPADVLLDSVAEIVEFAQQARVILAAENTRRRDYIDFVFERIDCEYLRFCYDSGHDFIWSDEQIAVLKRWGHKLIMTHLHDNKGENDDHLIPLTGKIDWQKVVAAWPKDYKGPLMLEVVGNPETESPDVFLKRAFENLIKLKNLKI